MEGEFYFPFEVSAEEMIVVGDLAEVDHEDDDGEVVFDADFEGVGETGEVCGVVKLRCLPLESGAGRSLSRS